MSLLSVMPVLGKILDRVIPDKDARARAEEELHAARQNGELDVALAQLQVNQVEAAHRSLFVAGWRPGIGWVCVFGLAYNVIVSPLLSIWMEVPTVDPALLYPVMLGMLGLTGARTLEKMRGISR